MSEEIPSSLRQLIDSRGPSDLADLAEILAGQGELHIDVGGRSFSLSADARAALVRMVEQMQRGDDLRRQIDPSSMSVRLEPIVDLRNREAVGYEALTSFGDHSTLAGAWFREAAELGVSHEVEIAAIELALEKLTDIDERAYLSINISPRAALSADFGVVLRNAAPERVVIELTEHAAVEDYAALNAALLTLRGRGVRVAVDDAGAGFSSLNHILLIKPEIVKLDVSLVRDADTDLARRALISGLIFFAEHISAVTVAEGVETADQAKALRQLGVHYAQGWHFDSGPV
jgi:EAL domain-containing protein (putative c-di-GMP-specific phosphodiesterase class I)